MEKIFSKKIKIKDPVLFISFWAAILSCLIPLCDNKNYEYVTGKILSGIDFKTLVLLFSLMAIVKGLEEINIFQFIASKIIYLLKNTRTFYLGFVLFTFFISPFITNDVALITLVPFVLLVVRILKLDDVNFVISLIVWMSCAANLGSSITVIGNPQNLFLYSFFNLSVEEISKIYFPYFIISFICIVLSSLKIKKKKITLPKVDNYEIDIRRLVIYLLMTILVVLTLMKLIDYIVLFIIISIFFAIISPKILLKIDYKLLLTFTCLFIFISNISNLQILIDLINKFNNRIFELSILMSQFISNVPTSILISNFSQDYKEIILGTNIGGLGTIIASMASLISYKFFSIEYKDEKRKYLIHFTLINFGLLFILLMARYFLLLIL